MALTPVQKRLQEERKKRKKTTVGERLASERVKRANTTTEQVAGGTVTDFGKQPTSPEGTTRQVFTQDQAIQPEQTQQPQEAQQPTESVLTPEELKIKSESEAMLKQSESDLSDIEKQIEVSLRESVDVAREKARLDREAQQQQLDITQRQAQAASQGLGAFGSTTAASQAFGAGQRKALGQARTVAEFNIGIIDRQLEEKQRQVQEFFAKKDKASAQKALDTLAEIEELRLQKQREEIAQGEQVKTEAQTSLEAITKLSPASIAGMNEDDLVTLFDQAGLPSYAATAFISENAKLSEAMAELQADPTNVDKQNRVFALQGKIDKIKSEAAVTEFDKNIEGFTNSINALVASGDITQERANELIQARLSKEAGLPSATDQELNRLKIEAGKTDNAQKRAELQEQIYNLQQYSNIYPQGETPIDKLESFTSGEKITERFGVGDISYAGECGAFVNDMNGTPYRYGSSLSSKKKNINNNDVLNPKVGSIFVSTLGNETVGHVGFVKSINEDGTVTLADVNRNQNGQYNERNVRLEDLATKEGIIGYEDPVSTAKTSAIPRDVKETLDSLFTPGSGLTYTEAAKGYSGVKNASRLNAFSKEYARRKAELMNSQDVRDNMLGSAGGAKPDATWRTSFEKTTTSIDNITNLSNILNKDSIKSRVAGEEDNVIDLSPITGWIQSRNPWDEEGALANAALTQSIPNLARGVYGEVGVLTDQDVALYKSTLPNLTQPEEIRKTVTALTVRSVRTALERKLRTAAATGINVSGLIPEYNRVDAQVRSLEAELGISEPTTEEYVNKVTEKANDALGQYLDTFN